MSNKLFQGFIVKMKDSLDRTIGVMDDNATVIACSDSARMGENNPMVKEELVFTSDSFYLNDMTYKPFSTHGKVEYIVFVQGTDEISKHLSLILSASLSSMKSLYDEKYDMVILIKNIILDNILPSDIYVKSKEFRISNNIPRAVFLIRFMEKGDTVPLDIIQNMFPDKNKDYVVGVGENDVVLVREFKTNVEAKELENMAKTIVDTLNAEFYLKVVIGIGTAVEAIKDLARSYKEAQVAIEVGKVFEIEKSVINYENLGIGRLIYQLPTTLCEMFLHEVFKKGSIEALDRETLITIQCFFENNLNVSETSRKLFVHRNTLVYRLEKIRKLTGLDLREFEHAITFKVALMVKKYLSSRPAKY